MTGYQTIPGHTSLPKLTQALSVHCTPVTSNYGNINYPVHHLKHIPGQYPACTSEEELQYSPGQSIETPLLNHCITSLGSKAVMWHDDCPKWQQFGCPGQAMTWGSSRAALRSVKTLGDLLRSPTCFVWPPCTTAAGQPLGRLVTKTLHPAGEKEKLFLFWFLH